MPVPPDFDQPIDRSGTHALKFEGRLQKFGRADIQPLWIADMDFAAPAHVYPFLQRFPQPAPPSPRQKPGSSALAPLASTRQQSHWAPACAGATVVLPPVT